MKKMSFSWQGVLALVLTAIAIITLPLMAEGAPDPREIKLAEQLIGTLEDRFDAAAYKDEYREQVLALLEAKSRGKVVRFPKAARRKPTDSLLRDLQASLKGGRRASGGD